MIMTMPRAASIVLLVFAGGAVLQAAAATYGGKDLATDGRAQLQDGCANILAYGGDRSGRRDNAPAFREAAGAGDPDAVCVHIPAGTYRFASSPALTAGAALDAAIAITGDGAGLSRLLFDAGVSGPALHLTKRRQSFAIRDLSILGGSAGEEATGLSVVQSGAPDSNPAPSEIRGVVVRGRDGFGGVDRFATGIALHRVSNVTLANVTIAGSPDGAPYATRGVCLLIDGTADAIPIQINIVAAQINHCGRGLVYGPYLQGVQIVASNFTGNGTAIHQPAGNVGNDQLAITASQFNSGLHDILLEAPIDGVTIGASHFYLAETGSGDRDARRAVRRARQHLPSVRQATRHRGRDRPVPAGCGRDYRQQL